MLRDCNLSHSCGFVYVLPLDTYERLGSGAPLMQTNTVLTEIGNAKIRPEGEVKLRVVNPNTSETRMLDLYVTNASGIAILGYKACTAVDLMCRVFVDAATDNVLTEANTSVHQWRQHAQRWKPYAPQWHWRQHAPYLLQHAPQWRQHAPRRRHHAPLTKDDVVGHNRSLDRPYVSINASMDEQN